MEKLLIVDDSPEILKQLKWGLGKSYEILLAENVEEAIQIFTAHAPRVITLDLGLPPDADGASEGLRCLEIILSLRPSTKVIVLSGNEDRGNALKAVQLGAYDFYQKPIELTELKIILGRAFHLTALEEENRRLQSASGQRQGGMHGIFGQCQAMEATFSTIRKVASADIPVMVLGENGTGKEMVARAIHNQSLRKDGPFIPINCGAIPENLLESELFGHEKGAFTGAAGRVQGKVEFAHGGTLFLDEIGELPLPLQVKLLRFLQEKVIQRVGGREDITIDARILAATNVDIDTAIKDGRFREDLYYRIGVINLRLPPLRDRGDDIRLLAGLFLSRYSNEFQKKIKGFSAAAESAMKRYAWPGNVRELENKIKRAIIMSDSPVLDPVDLGFSASLEKSVDLSVAGMTLKEGRDKVERELLESSLKTHVGNVAKAAESLGVSRPTFYDLMKKHGLQNS
ncbi:PEP-CTERM-box response regulator transcription factor [Trichloromonas sp.]|uniref:PEP-CTERM-box response regulator transcription factor n=1 Tax=Trichloromonas sp. TaxID=3069249 RepID=UPI003D814C61